MIHAHPTTRGHRLVKALKEVRAVKVVQVVTFLKLLDLLLDIDRNPAQLSVCWVVHDAVDYRQALAALELGLPPLLLHRGGLVHVEATRRRQHCQERPKRALTRGGRWEKEGHDGGDKAYDDAWRVGEER